MFDNVEDAFKDLDKKEYMSFARALAGYRKALLDQGFTRREALRIVEGYSKFIYEWALEEALSAKRFGDMGLGEDPLQ